MVEGQTIQSGKGVKPDAKTLLLPLGDCNLLVRFGDTLSDKANRRAVLAAQILSAASIPGVMEVTPSLVSVCLRYDQRRTGFSQLSANVSLALNSAVEKHETKPRTIEINVAYGGEFGPDFLTAAAKCKLSPEEFVAAHNSAKLRVLATGFAPGFVYCGMHKQSLHISRRKKIHTKVPPGSVIFAAGQTAITATSVPTGWHVIGRTEFRNFNATNVPPTKLAAGNIVHFTGRIAQ